jgi:hypothetical protein
VLNQKFVYSGNSDIVWVVEKVTRHRIELKQQNEQGSWSVSKEQFKQCFHKAN